MTQTTFNNGDSGLIARTAINDNANDAETRLATLEGRAFGSLFKNNTTDVPTNITNNVSFFDVNYVSIQGQVNNFQQSADGELEYLGIPTIAVRVECTIGGFYALGNDDSILKIALNGTVVSLSNGIRFNDAGSTAQPTFYADIPAIATNDKINAKVINLTDSTDFSTMTADLSVWELP